MDAFRDYRAWALVLEWARLAISVSVLFALAYCALALVWGAVRRWMGWGWFLEDWW